MAERGGKEAAEKFVVRYENAFPSFFSEADRRRIEELLSNPSRGPRRPKGDPSAFPFSILRMARCAFPRADGSRCGRMVRAGRPTESAVGHSTYTGHSCRRWTRPRHSTNVPAALGEHVLDVILEVFDPAQLRRVAQRLQVDAAQLAGKSQVLRTQIEEMDSKIEAAESSALEEAASAKRARRGGEKAKATVHDQRKEKRDDEAVKYRLEATGLRNQLAALEAQEEEFLSARNGDLEKIISLGTDLPALIERAWGVPYAVQNIVHALVQRVWVREYGARVAEFTVEFPSGAEIRRLVTFERVGCTQPERMYARGALAAGVPVETVARDLGRSGDPRSSGWSPERVQGVALYAQHFDCTPVRMGEYRTVSELEKATGATRTEILAAAFRDKLGPALWEGGELSLCPTEAELQRAFTEYAAREVARAHGLVGRSLILERRLRRLNGVAHRAPRGFGTGVALYSDGIGRHWVDTVDAAARGLRVEEGIPPTEAELEMRRVAVEQLGRPELHPEDFHPASELGAHLRSRFAAISYGRIHVGVRRGSITHVRVPTWGLLRHPRGVLLVHVPPKVLDTTDPAVVGRWLRAGRRPHADFSGPPHPARRTGLRRE